ncbi:MAG TPA: STAS domain-containing protein [Pyrinomonadaceae bacterium]|jgi:anti-anti-sigma factor
MPTRITQLEDGTRTILRVEGSLTLEDAELIERICGDLREQSDNQLVIDLTDLNFLDSESASVLHRLKRQGVELEGLHYFIQKEIELVEREEVKR